VVDKGPRRSARGKRAHLHEDRHRIWPRSACIAIACVIGGAGWRTSTSSGPGHQLAGQRCRPPSPRCRVGDARRAQQLDGPLGRPTRPAARRSGLAKASAGSTGVRRSGPPPFAKARSCGDASQSAAGAAPRTAQRILAGRSNSRAGSTPATSAGGSTTRAWTQFREVCRPSGRSDLRWERWPRTRRRRGVPARPRGSRGRLRWRSSPSPARSSSRPWPLPGRSIGRDPGVLGETAGWRGRRGTLRARQVEQ
jgi:hypothetical protein